MQISNTDWNRYVERLSKVNKTAAKKMQEYIQKYGTENTEELIRYAYGIVEKYSEAASAAACDMFEAIAEAENVMVPAAVPAEHASYGEVAKTVNGTVKYNNTTTLENAIARLVKRSAADTMLMNAERNGAQFAWIPHGDTCAFCITLASRGWQNMSKKALKNGHAEHIHANCDCQYAIRFDNKTNVQGYDPDKYLEMYNGDNKYASPKEKLKSLRSALNQKNKNSFVKITEQAIEKIKEIGPKEYTSEKLQKLKEMNQELLRVSKNENNSMEVAMYMDDISGIGKPILGEKDYVDITADVDFMARVRRRKERNIIISHNHPSLSYFSMDDIGIFVYTPQIKTMEVVTNQGKVWFIHKNDRYNDMKAVQILHEIEKENIGANLDDIVDIFLEKTYNMIERN